MYIVTKQLHISIYSLFTILNIFYIPNEQACGNDVKEQTP